MTDTPQLPPEFQKFLQLPDAEEAARRRQLLEERRLSEHAYTQRRAMLVTAALLFAISWGGVRLSSIEVLGIQITVADEQYLLAFASAIFAYLIGNFATHAQPSIVAWRADLDWFSVDARRVVQSSTQMILQGISGVRRGLTELGASGEQAASVFDSLNKLETFCDADNVKKRAERYLELHAARLRFEYRVPVWISFTVLYAMIPRLLTLETM